MKLIAKIISLSLFMIYSDLYGQNFLRLDSALAKAEKYNFFVKSGYSNIEQKKSLQVSAFNIPNPDIITEAPTGYFYSFGFMQTLDFPSVYIVQTQLAKQNTILEEKTLSITTSQVKLQTSIAFVEYQYLKQKRDLLFIQDSLYTSLKLNSERKFNVGEIDFLQYTFVSSQAGEVHTNYMLVNQQLDAALIQLKLYTGIVDSIMVDSLNVPDISSLLVPDSTLYRNNAMVEYFDQVVVVQKKQVQLEKHKAIPGFVFGYLNQGPIGNPISMNLRVGINVPLWFWQYSGNISAAKSGLESSIYEAQGNILKTQSDISTVQSQAITAHDIVTYYQNNGLVQSNELINSSRRIFDAGLMDYIQYLRTLNEAYLIQLNYLEQLRNLNHAINTYNYLIGKI